ncbi:MAG: ATP-binding protein [Umezawaea sp.]
MSRTFPARAELLRRIAEVLRSPRPGPVVLTGERGIGRSTVLASAARLVDGGADAVIHLHAAAGHLATLRSLLPDEPFAPRSPSTLDRATDALVEHAGGRRPVVLLDDAHLVDHATTQVLRSLHRRTGAVLLMSQLSGHRTTGGPDPLDCLRYEPGFQVLPIPPLTEDELGSELALVLGGEVDGTALTALRTVTGGNPALVERFLADGALRSETTVRDGRRTLADVPRPKIALDAQGKRHLRDAVAEAWRELSLDVLDQVCKLAAYAGESATVSAVWAQVRLLLGRPRQAMAFLDDLEPEPTADRAFARAVVLGLGLGRITDACTELDDAARAIPADAARLGAVRAWLGAIGGATAVTAPAATSDRWVSAFGQAAAVSGETHPSRAVPALRRALIAADRLRDEVPWLHPLLTARLVDCLLLAGRITEATSAATELRRSLPENGWSVLTALGSRTGATLQGVHG